MGSNHTIFFSTQIDGFTNVGVKKVHVSLGPIFVISSHQSSSDRRREDKSNTWVKLTGSKLIYLEKDKVDLQCYLPRVSPLTLYPYESSLSNLVRDVVINFVFLLTCTTARNLEHLQLQVNY